MSFIQLNKALTDAFCTMTYGSPSIQTWQREADRYQKIADARRAAEAVFEAKRRRRNDLLMRGFVISIAFAVTWVIIAVLATLLETF